MANPTAADAERNNFRDFRAPKSGYWFGRGGAAVGDGVLVTIKRHGRGLTIRDMAGEIVASFGDTTKFWFIADAQQNEADAPRSAPPPASSCD